MTKKLLVQIKNEWRNNLWLALELLVVSVVMWFVVDYLYTRMATYLEPRGFDISHCYLIEMGKLTDKSPDYIPNQTDEQEDADILELVDRLRRRPEIEAVSLSQNSYPYNGSNSTDLVQYDTLVSDNWTIRRLVTPDFVRVFRYQGTRGETPDQLAGMLEKGEFLASDNLYRKYGHPLTEFVGYHLRENPIITWVSVLGTALAICMIMVLVITFQVRLVDCEPEVNRSRSLYVSAMSVKNKGGSDGDSSNARMSVRTGRECFKNLTTAEAVTLVSLPEKVRVSLPAGNKVTADMVQTDDAFWHIFRFRFLSGKAFTKADSDAGVLCAVLSAAVARRLFGTTDVAGKTVQLNYVEYRISGVVTDVSVLATSAYAQVWVPYTSTDIARLTWWEETMGQMRAVILARSAADFPAIREEAEQLRRKYNDSLRDSEVFYRGQPDEQFANLYRKWSETPDTKAIILRYMLVIAILLLVPAINLSSMTLSRMRRRMAEIGVRKAFGATGGELIRQIFFENLLLTLFAGVLGLALSYAATFLLNGFLFNNSTNAYLSGETALTPGMLLSPWAFLAAFGFCLLMNILSAGIPAWRASRMNITDAINQR